MKKIRLGKTELMVTRTAFGALPVQRRTKEEGAKLLRAAYEGGINFFDTANAYTDSEEKIGMALSDVRGDVIIATKSGGADRETVARHIEMSLERMRTDYIDVFQFHNPAKLPDPEDPEGPYAAAMEAKRKGYIRHIGITNHRLNVAWEAVRSGNFETLQFPFSYLSGRQEMELVEGCREADMGFIAMKGLAGGLLTNVTLCRAFMNQFDNVVPIWGIQFEDQLAQWLAAEEAEPSMTPELCEELRREREALGGSFCRGCGYCLPCPANIEIYTMARLDMLLTRSPYKPYLTDSFHEKAMRMADCIHCNACKSRCPYELDTPKLVEYNLENYRRFYSEHEAEQVHGA